MGGDRNRMGGIRDRYQVVRHNVDELVGRLNGQHSTIGFVPVRYLYQSVSKEKLVALYALPRRASDFAGSMSTHFDVIQPSRWP